MKSVLITTRPQCVEKIASGEKTIEVRKTAPKEVPFKAYIYCTYGNMKENYCLGMRGKVIGEFVCDKVYSIKNRGSSFYVADEEQSVTNEIARQSCLYYDDMVSYFGNKDGFGWHISDLKIYDKPKELGDFKKHCHYKDRNSYCLANECEYYSDWTGICCNWVEIPPQSWCYVEDLGEEK